MLSKCCTQCARKFAKLSSGHGTEKGQFSFQSQRRAMPKNVQTTTHLPSFHTIERSCSKSSKLGFNSMWTMEFQMCKLDLEKAEEPEIKLPTPCWTIKKAREFQKNIYYCFIDYTKIFDYIYHNKLWKIFKEMGVPDHPTCLLRDLYAGQEATIRNGHGITDFQNWERRTARVHTIILLIQLICRVYHVKCQAGWTTSWNHDFQ